MNGGIIMSLKHKFVGIWLGVFFVEPQSPELKKRLNLVSVKLGHE